MRTREEIINNIAYEQQDGEHTFSMCPCNRMGCRSGKCTLCLTEELNDVNEQLNEGDGK